MNLNAEDRRPSLSFHFLYPLCILVLLPVFILASEPFTQLLTGRIYNTEIDPVAGVKVYPYIHSGSEGITMPGHFPEGAGFFSPPGEEEIGWYLFEVTSPDGHQFVSEPIFVGEEPQRIVISTDKKVPYFLNSSNQFDKLKLKQSFLGASNRIEGYILNRDQSPLVGASVKLFRFVDLSVTTEDEAHPEGLGFYEFKSSLLEGEYRFHLEFPEAGSTVSAPVVLNETVSSIYLTQTGSVHLGVAPKKSAQKNIAQGDILLFGDSDSTLSSGYPSRLGVFLEESKELKNILGSKFKVHIRAKGDTPIGNVSAASHFGVEQITKGLSSSDAKNASLALLRFGINDVHYYLHRLKDRDKEKFSNNYRRAIELVLDSKILPILFELHYEKPDSVRGSYDPAINWANSELRRLSVEYEVPIVRNRINCRKQTEFCYDDRVHLNDNGHRELSNDTVETILEYGN